LTPLVAPPRTVTRWATGVREHEPVDELRVRVRLRNRV